MTRTLYDKLYKEVPSYTLVSPAAVSEKESKDSQFPGQGSPLQEELLSEGFIKLFPNMAAFKVTYARNTKVGVPLLLVKMHNTSHQLYILKNKIY